MSRNNNIKYKILSAKFRGNKTERNSFNSILIELTKKSKKNKCIISDSTNLSNNKTKLIKTENNSFQTNQQKISPINSNINISTNKKRTFNKLKIKSRNETLNFISLNYIRKLKSDNKNIITHYSNKKYLNQIKKDIEFKQKLKGRLIKKLSNNLIMTKNDVKNLNEIYDDNYKKKEIEELKNKSSSFRGKNKINITTNKSPGLIYSENNLNRYQDIYVTPKEFLENNFSDKEIFTILKDPSYFHIDKYPFNETEFSVKTKLKDVLNEEEKTKKKIKIKKLIRQKNFTNLSILNNNSINNNNNNNNNYKIFTIEKNKDKKIIKNNNNINENNKIKNQINKNIINKLKIKLNPKLSERLILLTKPKSKVNLAKLDKELNERIEKRNIRFQDKNVWFLKKRYYKIEDKEKNLKIKEQQEKDNRFTNDIKLKLEKIYLKKGK